MKKFTRELVDDYFEEYAKTENHASFKKLLDAVTQAYLYGGITAQEDVYVMNATKGLHCY